MAAAGKCYPDKLTPSTHMGLRRTEDTCTVRGYCADEFGPAACIDGSCFCPWDCSSDVRVWSACGEVVNGNPPEICGDVRLVVL